MRKLLFSLSFLILCFAAQTQSTLSVEKIMRDPKWIGTSPSDLQWSPDGNALFFKWNPEKAKSDSLYLISLKNKKPIKLVAELAADVSATGEPEYNQARSAYVYSRGGDIFYHEIKTGKTRRITQTPGSESTPRFSFNEERIVYQYDQQLYSWTISSGTIQQLTDFKTGNPPPARDNNRSARSGNQQETWLERDQLEQFEVLKSRKATRDSQEAWNKSLVKMDKLRTVYVEDMNVQGIQISPDGRFISYSLSRPATGAKRTIVPAFVTESGFTTDIPTRTKVGAPVSKSTFYILDRIRDSIFEFKTDSVPGIQDLPDYVKDYPKQLEQLKEKPSNREIFITGVSWAPSAAYAVLDILSRDNKDRWLLLWSPATGTYATLDRQRDEAWIGGPGISFTRNRGWINDQQFWFQSEATGYSHLYIIDVNTKQKKALTSGNFEIQQAVLSHDKKYFFITSNEVNPGEKQFYRLSIGDGKKERITTLTGAHQVTISPDQKNLAILYSYSNKPWELYLQENKPGATAEQITDKAQSDEFKSYPWRDPELVTFKAGDGATVYARFYKPSNPHPSKPAVIFVHGAGYLQNAHKWWSSYFREYMFHNLLTDMGYTVLDIDYRGSAGYGRDWRTGIYRHMGGKDLSDHVDAVKWLVSTHAVDSNRIGIYGGSYGGFITLMALFNESQHFTSGAALRPVTDWANYNHGYTSNILNEPFKDSLAYRRSSPWYFADGLKGHLLICHGMVDENVHYQDAVKLAQRLIELGKDNWELASYPVEDHGFVEPSSWKDEYKRILKLFEQTLK